MSFFTIFLVLGNKFSIRISVLNVVMTSIMHYFDFPKIDLGAIVISAIIFALNYVIYREIQKESMEEGN